MWGIQWSIKHCSQEAYIPLENTGEQSMNRVASGSNTFYEEKQTKKVCVRKWRAEWLDWIFKESLSDKVSSKSRHG